ncbi:MAG: response regulator [Proteobacteria bacterium]|nr:response regulator [Pseudomonadota bacterium]
MNDVRVEPPLVPSTDAGPVLVMDKDPMIVATLAEVLRRAGLAVTPSTSAAEALGQVRATAHALAVVDQSAFDGEGAAFATTWAEAAVPLVFMSANGSPERIRRAIDAGAVGYFVKPVDPVQFAPGVYVALRRARDRAALAAEVTRLREVVDTNSEVGVAVGLLMAHRGVPRHVAFETLRQNARRSRRRLSVIAAEVASLATRLNDIQSIPPTVDKKPGATSVVSGTAYRRGLSRRP